MSKKKKDKFKKQIKAQILEEMTKAQATSTPVASTTMPMPNVKPNLAAAATIDNSVIQNLAQIKYDLKKTAVVIGILALMIVALVILDQKYNLLLTFGGWLFRVLHIN